ncbi:hypothetical protein B0G81_2178 [Paraburkholderia sp. BL6665CI2N2]|nr:hypothetical protein B0G81_2178 [Paraburkholderia sp. BL6665CI2N2]
MRVVDAAAPLSPFMTIEIDTFTSEAEEHRGDWSQVARLDFITDGRVVHAGIWMNEGPEKLLPTIPVLDGDTAWSVFVRLLERQSDSCTDG